MTTMTLNEGGCVVKMKTRLVSLTKETEVVVTKADKRNDGRLVMMVEVW